MHQEKKPHSKRATASNTNNDPPLASGRVARTGEQCLLKWIDLLSQNNGNSHDHHIARVLAHQCHEIATHPTFRPMYSDVCPTFICPPEKRKVQPPQYFKPSDDDTSSKNGKKRKQPTTSKMVKAVKEAKKEKVVKEKKKKSQPPHKQSKRQRLVFISTLSYSVSECYITQSLNVIFICIPL